MCFNIYVIKILLTNPILHMKTIVWLIAIFALSAFIFSATVNAANNLAKNLWLNETAEKVSIQELMKR